MIVCLGGREIGESVYQKEMSVFMWGGGVIYMIQCECLEVSCADVFLILVSVLRCIPIPACLIACLGPIVVILLLLMGLLVCMYIRTYVRTYVYMYVCMYVGC